MNQENIALKKNKKKAGTVSNAKDFKKDQGGQEVKGDICKVCDRKFFIKEIVQDKNLQIEAQTNQLLGAQGLNSQMEGSQTELQKIREDYDKERKLYALDYQKLQLVKDERRTRLRKTKKQNEDVELKNLEQMDRQEAKRKEIIELDEEINLYQEEMTDMNEELQRIEQHIIITQQENRRLQFQWEEKQEEMKEAHIRTERDNQHKAQKQAKAAQEAAAKAKKDQKAEKKKRKQTEKTSISGAAPAATEEKGGSRSNSISECPIREKTKPSQQDFEDAVNTASVDVDVNMNERHKNEEVKTRKASSNSTPNTGPIEQSKDINKKVDTFQDHRADNNQASRDVDNHHSVRFNEEDEGYQPPVNTNKAPNSPLVRRNSFADESQTNLDISNGHKHDLQSSYQETLENYYPEGRGSINTFTNKEDLFPKYTTRTVSTAAKLDEDGDVYDIPDLMGVPRTGSANDAERMRVSQNSGRSGRRAKGDIRKRARTKTSLQDGPEGLHKDQGCCNDQQCTIF